MHGTLDNEDRQYVRQAVELSKGYEQNQSRWPFGAILVMDGKVVGQGVNQVVELHDPAAHAEIMALRDAGAATGQHIFQDSVLYSSCEPCPMCLAACCWALVPRIVYAATSYDTADYGLRDRAIYDELALPPEHRSIRADASDEDLRQEAIAAVRDWTQRYRRTGVHKVLADD
ncbi:MAG TPA: nucleoside deaminase [Streptosporangiaceae bacterium]|jgi:tRNA(Arg) A34 adenosine deaminase TadA